MQWFFEKDGVKTEIPVERWCWMVLYKDGSRIKQFGDDGVFHQIGEVDQENAHVFVLYKHDNEAQRIDIVLPEGAKIIHKYKNYVFNFGTAAEAKVRVYVFGYKVGNQYHFNFVMPNDAIIQATTEEAVSFTGSAV